MEKAIVKTKKNISPVWILPIIALLIGGWLIAKSIQDDGCDIVLRMEEAGGITPGKTQVIYKGIPVGIIKKLNITKDLQYVDAIIEMKKQSKDKLVEDTRFWVVRPEVSMNQITGLDTLISGSYIGVSPGKSKTPTTRYTALKDAPAALENAPGLHITLLTGDSSTQESGAPILFKKIQVGEIISTRLEKDAAIRINLLIYEQHAHLVTTSTLFWDASGIEFNANLTNINLKVGSFKSILAGGITFETPSGGEPVSSGQTFPLYQDAAKARHADDIKITLNIPSGQGVNPGANIKYRNVVIGTITDVTLADDLKSMIAVAGISKEFEKLLRKDTYIWEVSPEISISGVNNLDSVVTGAYLKLLPGHGKPGRTFIVHAAPPARIKEISGLSLVLESESLGSLKKNHPVYYRQVKVGHVTGAELSETRKKVFVYINIHEPFTDLISEHTRFWNVCGIRIEGGLMTTMKISSESIESLISGGIALATPEMETKDKPVKEDHRFILHREIDEEWLEWLEWSSDKVINLEEKKNDEK